MDNNIAATLPFGNGTIVVEACADGYDFYISNGELQVKSFRVTDSARTFQGKTFHSSHIIRYSDHFDQNSGVRNELITPNNMPEVILRDDRPFCRLCYCFVPNTANYEMRKEGCFAHSHCCGVRSSGEYYLVPESLVKLFETADHAAADLVETINTVASHNEDVAVLVENAWYVVDSLPSIARSIQDNLKAEETFLVSPDCAASVAVAKSLLQTIYDATHPFEDENALKQRCALQSMHMLKLLQLVGKHWTIN